MNLKTARENKGLSQEKAAQLIGVSYKTIHRYENGSPIPSNILFKLAELYGVPKSKAYTLVEGAA